MKFWKKLAIGFLIVIALTAVGITYLRSKIDIETEATIILNTSFIKGDFQKTIEQFEKLLTKAKKKEGDSSKNVVMLNSCIARLYIELDEYDIAELYILDAKQISDDIKLEESPIDDIHSILGQLEGRKKNYDAAISYFNEALRWRQKLYGENSDKVGVVYYQMAEVSKELGMYDEARSYAMQGINSINYTSMKLNEVNCYLLLGELELEQENYKEALDRLYSCERIAGYAVDYQTPQGGLVYGRIYDRMEQAMSGIPDYSTSAILYTGMKSYRFKEIASKGFKMDPEILEEQKMRVLELWKQDHNSDDTDSFEDWFQNSLKYPVKEPF